MKRTIAIIAGGDSSEYEVSMNSAKGIYSFIDKEKYNLYLVELTRQKWEAILTDVHAHLLTKTTSASWRTESK